MRTMPRCFNMSWPASCTMRSRANRSGLSTTIVRAPLASRASNIAAKPGRPAKVTTTAANIEAGRRGWRARAALWPQMSAQKIFRPGQIDRERLAATGAAALRTRGAAKAQRLVD
jgi:hypothetical protein